jgi:putative oxidoreductase
MRMRIDAGLALLRIFVGLLVAAHGSQKLFGWFGGGGIDATAQMFGSLGYRPRREMALLGGSVEFGAGLLLAGGLFTAIAAMALIGQFLNIIVAVHLRNGVWNMKGGFEFPLTLAIAIAMLALTGPGSWSLDHAIGWTFGGVGWFITALLGGLLAGGLVLASRRIEVASEQQQQERGREAA